MRRHLRSKLANHKERITRNSFCVRAAIVRVVFVLKGKRAVRLNPTRKVWIAACHQSQISFQDAIRGDRPRAIHARVETEIRTQQLKPCAFGQKLSS